MSGGRPWYREPETFIALTALVVSVSAVAVGIYEAALQRRHDRAEVWPHLELSTFTTPNGASLSVENTGIGPALIKSVVVTVDGKRAHNWTDVLTTLLGHAPATGVSNSTIAESALRPGDKVMMVGVPNVNMPPSFWSAVRRVGITVCYSSVFEEHWIMRDSGIGGRTRWEPASGCPAQADGEDF
jgi:hypothetical protein